MTATMGPLRLFCDLCDQPMECTNISVVCARCFNLSVEALWPRPITPAELRAAAGRVGVDLKGADLTQLLREQVRA